MYLRRLVLAAAVVPVLSVSHAQAAEDCAAPCFGYGFSAELAGDWIFNATPDSTFEAIDIEPALDTDLFIRPVEHVSLVSLITTESVLDPTPGKHRAFQDIGTYVERLYAEIEYEPAVLRFGKFEPDFGLATHRLDGIYATDLIGDYDNAERWGAEAVVDFEAFGLSHAISASAFTTDRTVLSESFFTNRGRLRLSDGGAGNSKGISSFVALLDGCKGAKAEDCYAEGQFGYRLGFRHQEAGQAPPLEFDDDGEPIDAPPPHDETGLLAAATARFDIDPVTLRLLGEFSYFDHFDGGPDDAWFLTLASSAEIEPLTLMASYTRRQNLVTGEPDTTENLVDLTAAYQFGEEQSFAGEQWTIAAAYRYRRDDAGQKDHTIGLTLTVDLAGTIGGSGTGK